ncbi:MAG: flavodoxin family protein [Ignavibacteriales bacterium]
MPSEIPTSEVTNLNEGKREDVTTGTGPAKKVTAIVGSPRKGDTYRIVKMVEERLAARGAVDFEYVLLKDCHFEPCSGCGLCITRGERYCPRKDDLAAIFNRMTDSDGVIVATPVYSLHVTALVKNLLDRLAYVFHRPCFFHKAFMPVVAQGIYGADDVLKYLETVARFWGFKTCRGVSVTTLSVEAGGVIPGPVTRSIDEAAGRFHRLLNDPRDPAPSFKDIAMFRGMRGCKPALAKIFPFDYEYFKERGWLQSDYFYEVRLNPFKRAFGAFVDWQTGRMNRKQPVNGSEQRP